MLPVAGAALALNHRAQLGAHGDDALRHLLHVLQPLGAQGGVVEDHGGDAGAVHRRVRVQRADDDLQLGHHLGRLLRAAGHHGEGADALAVEAHVLRVGLRQHQLVAIFDEEADGGGVAVNVSGGEALVGHVEEWKEVALLDQVRQLLPLVQLLWEEVIKLLKSF